MKKSIFTILLALAFVGCNENASEEKKTIEQKENKEEIKTFSNTNFEQKVLAKTLNENNEKENLNLEIKEDKEKFVNAEVLFKTCSSCHGLKAEKEALGKSQIIKAWDKDRLIMVLNGYKDGTYGGAMKNIMKQYVDKKTPEEIEALAEFISKL